MKLPLSYLSHFPTTPSQTDEPQSKCVLAVDLPRQELELYCYPSVIGHAGKVHFAGTQEHTRIVEEKVRLARRRQRRGLNRIQIVTLQEAQRALQHHLGLSPAQVPEAFVARCLSTIPAPFCVTELPASDPLLAAA